MSFSRDLNGYILILIPGFMYVNIPLELIVREDLWSI